jgi:predicted nucleotidyltransferase
VLRPQDSAADTGKSAQFQPRMGTIGVLWPRGHGIDPCVRIPRSLTLVGDMRLTSAQREIILQIVRTHAGDDAVIWLYGSRTDDVRRGGDIDLLVRPSRPIDLMQQASMHARLEQELLLPVDISFIDPRRGMTRFQKLAAARAEPLEVAR